jgi:NAD(P)-dependent dehydrogenase (short-subunit alcohol dehydrogenase family)
MSTDRTYKQRSYKPLPAYADSKLANILFTSSLAKKMPSNVLAFALHPGVIATNLSRSLGILGYLYRFVGRLFLKSIPQGAATSVYAATAPELAADANALAERAKRFIAELPLLVPTSGSRSLCRKVGLPVPWEAAAQKAA